MGPVLVVVGHEHIKNTLKVLLVQNQHPVETLRAGGAYKPLGHTVGLRRAKRSANNLDPVASKHLIKSVGRLLVPIVSQETDVFGPHRGFSRARLSTNSRISGRMGGRPTGCA
jgi:hypothetical protein